MSLRTIVLLLLVVLSSVSCTVAQLELPPDAWDVEGSNPRVWNRPISFGPYRTDTVHEGATRSWLADTKILQVAKAEQAVHLTMNGIAVECHTKELVLGTAGFFVDSSFGREPLLVCGYDAAGLRTVLTLSRTGKVEPSLAGSLRTEDGTAIEVRSLHSGEGVKVISSDPWGFELRNRGSRVAVVETINRGRVWIAPDASNRDTLAAVASSLLLFRDPDAGS